MSRKFYIVLFGCLSLLQGVASAQCAGGRYVSPIFTNVSKTTVTYSTAYGQSMDIYQPVGDTLTARPLIILAHGGSFISGTRSDDSTVLWLCENFAKRGYVTASIDYRLASSFLLMLDSTSAIDVVIKAVSDGKAAIRFFRDNANMATYKIDTNNIFAGGNSAGAVLYMHVGYLDSLAECTSDIATAMAANGGFEGNSGYPGHSSRPRAIINLAGALHSTSYVGLNDIPSVNAQGDADIVVPYTCADPNISVTVPVQLCGLGSLEPVYNTEGVYHMSHVFPGASHVPWASIPSDFFTVDSLVQKFLYTLVCTGVTDVAQPSTLNETVIFPNPASDAIYIHAGQNIASIELLDNTGRVVLQKADINGNSLELNTSRLKAGMYFVRVNYVAGSRAPEMQKIIIQ